MNGKVWLVAGREYKEHVAKRSFWIGLLLGPLFFAFIFAIQIVAFKLRPEETRNVAIVDVSGLVGEAVAADLREDKHKSGKAEFDVELHMTPADTTTLLAGLNRKVSEKAIFGYLMVGDSLDAAGSLRFYARNVGDAVTIDKVEDALRRAVIGARLTQRQLSITRSELDEITGRVSLVTLKIDESGKASKRNFGTVYLVTFAYLMIFFVPIIGYGVTALRGILEEKSSRIIEVLLSSVSPYELFMGKVVGLALVGLTQVGAYAVTGMALSGYSAMSAMPAGMMKEIGGYFSPVMMGLFVVYFLLGFVLFLSLFTAIGSMVNTEQEAQSMQQPIMWLLIIPMYATFFFISNPDSTIARVVSLIPVFTPMIMIMRISVLTPPWWEIVLSIVLTSATIVGVVWAASRVFRIGILMYGKKPSLPEIVKWVKTG